MMTGTSSGDRASAALPRKKKGIAHNPSVSQRINGDIGARRKLAMSALVACMTINRRAAVPAFHSLDFPQPWIASDEADLRYLQRRSVVDAGRLIFVLIDCHPM